MRRRKLRNENYELPADMLLGTRVPMASLIQTLAVAEHLNFRHAANALGVSQSSISTRVGKLTIAACRRRFLICSRKRRRIGAVAVGFLTNADRSIIMLRVDIPISQGNRSHSTPGYKGCPKSQSRNAARSSVIAMAFGKIRP